MKRLLIITGIIMLVAMITIPAIAFGPHGRWGGHMMGPWAGTNSPYMNPYTGRHSNLTDEQRQKVDKLLRKFYEDTQALRSRLWTKRSELNILISQANPDTSKIDALQKEISDLQSQLMKKRIDLRIQLKKIAPELAQNGGYGITPGPWQRRMGNYGYRPGAWCGPYQMGGYGYGPGACWY